MEELYRTNEEQATSKAGAKETSALGEYVGSGVPIVRASTPRPLPFGLVPSKTELPLAPSDVSTRFPVNAPTAPPVPEDPLGITETLVAQETSIALPAASDAASKLLANEFLWLFEYALDMDPTLLNRPERLNGSAFAYGLAVLHGYRLVFEGLDACTGHVLASLVATPDQPETEVWGMLYRVSRRLAQHENERASMLDKVHHAGTFVALEIRVRDAYRHREISCLTYVAAQTTRQHVSQLSPTERAPEPAYVKRLLQIARRQKLPGSYVQILEKLVPTVISATPPLPETPLAHTTDPLPAILSEHDLHDQMTSGTEMTLPDVLVEHCVGPWEVQYPVYLGRWMMGFALYICLLLLATLMLAIIQGLGVWTEIFNANFAPLGTPWYVLLYGLLGGCISCVTSLSRPCFTYPPTFVVLTWFIRPFLGAMLGALSYLILNSGVILLSTHPTQHFALCSLMGALAGLCEERLFFGKQHLPN